MKLSYHAIYIIWLREMIRFFRARSRLIASFSMPFFFLVFLGLGFNASARFSNIPPGINYIDFLAPGIIGMALLFDSISSGLSVLWDKQFGFLKEIMVAPVDRLSIVIGKISGGMTTAMMQGVVILLLAAGIGVKFTGFSGLLFSMVFMILIAISFVSLGLIFASKIEDMHGFQLITRLFAFPVFILSGAFFPVGNLPLWLQCLTYINPLTYGVDGLRYCLIGTNQFPVTTDLLLLVCFAVLMVTLSTHFFKGIEVD
jgi:ABC-2 type transport system permease protein